MSTALKRGRKLDPKAVAEAQNWRKQRIKYLLSQNRMSLSMKERNEARRLTGRWDFWNVEI